MGAQKPAAKIALKSVDGGERTYIAAAWRRDDGRMGGLRLDKRVTQLAVHLDDGSIIRVKRADGEKLTHFIDLFLEDDTTVRAPSARRDATPPSIADFDADDMPF